MFTGRRDSSLLQALARLSLLLLLAGCGGSGGGASDGPEPGGQPPPILNADRADPISTDPGGFVMNAAARRLYFVAFGSGRIVEIDADALEVTRAVGSSGGPIRAAVDPASGTLYVCHIRDNRLSLLDGATLQRQNEVSVGHAPRSVALMPGLPPDQGTAFVANYLDSTISVVDLETPGVVGAIRVPEFPRALAADPVTRRIYMIGFKDDTLTEIDADTRQIVRTVSVGARPAYVHVNPDTHRVYVTCHGDDSLSIFDPATGVTERKEVGGRPTGVWSSAARDVLCVAVEAARELRIFALSNGALLSAVPLEGTPQAVALDIAGGRAFVADYTAQRVHVVDLASRTLIKVIDVSGR